MTRKLRRLSDGGPLPPDEGRRYDELVEHFYRLFPDPEQALQAASMTLAAMLSAQNKTPAESAQYLLRVTAMLDADRSQL